MNRSFHSRTSSGELLLDGRDVQEMTEPELDRTRLQKLGFVLQAFNLFPVLNVYENIELPLLPRRHTGRASAAATCRAFRRSAATCCPRACLGLRAAADPGGRAYRQSRLTFGRRYHRAHAAHEADMYRMAA